MPPRKNASQYSRSSQPRRSRDESDDEEPSRTNSRPMPKSSQENSQYTKLSTDKREQLVNDCVHYLLIANQKGHPIKKIDIVKHVLKDHSKTFSAVIEKVANILKKVFGICLIEVANKKGTYMLVSNLDFKLPETDVELQLWSDTECAQHGLLMIILVVIFMNGNVIPEALLLQFLKKLGLDVESDLPHPLFGNIKKLLTQEFVRQLYLEHKLVPGSEPPVYEYRFGQRAVMETSKIDMLKLVCKLYEHMKPEHWVAQYQDATTSSQ